MCNADEEHVLSSNEGCSASRLPIPILFDGTYRTFADAVGVRTFDPADKALDVLAAAQKWGTVDPKPAARGATTATRSVSLAAGQRVTLADVPELVDAFAEGRRVERLVLPPNDFDEKTAAPALPPVAAPAPAREPAPAKEPAR